MENANQNNTAQPISTGKSAQKSSMLFALLIAAIFILVLFAVRSGSNLSREPLKIQTTTPTQKPIEKTTTVYFSPSLINMKTIVNPISVDIMADTNEHEITGVQLEMSYDPKIISQVRISSPPDSLFNPNTSLSLRQEVKPQSGRISYWIAVGLKAPSVKGTGKVARLIFSITNTSGVATQTFISFLPKTIVTQENEIQSVLKAATPLRILLRFSSSLPETSPQK